MSATDRDDAEALQARLLALFRRLTATDRQALLRFAEFLAAQGPVEASSPAKAPGGGTPEPPCDIPRPAQESVIQALRRLAKTYPMLDRRELLAPSSELVTQHMMYGRAAEEVIDELERLYREHYEAYRKRCRGEEA
ncbi:MAG: Crp/Fnr family transcriptional regulator [Gammaproteobacteria bacterium]|nr:MAG: Crp/Fnr family transcriptional regulator [Gammaproteobacteria bacterium]